VLPLSFSTDSVKETCREREFLGERNVVKERRGCSRQRGGGGRGSVKEGGDLSAGLQMAVGDAPDGIFGERIVREGEIDGRISIHRLFQSVIPFSYFQCHTK
jgi:hypothetical protein